MTFCQNNVEGICLVASVVKDGLNSSMRNLRNTIQLKEQQFNMLVVKYYPRVPFRFFCDCYLLTNLKDVIDFLNSNPILTHH